LKIFNCKFDVPRARIASFLFLTSVALCATAVLFLFDPSQSAFYPFCLFHRTTGLLCPGCGSLRALHHLLHGRLGTALHYNVLLISSLPWLAWFGARVAWARIHHEPAPVPIRPSWLWAAFVVLVIFSILRNFPFAHGAWLAP
jgi:hypothetical protein